MCLTVLPRCARCRSCCLCCYRNKDPVVKTSAAADADNVAVVDNGDSNDKSSSK